MPENTGHTMVTSFNITLDKLPLCPKCMKGDLLPIPDVYESVYFLKGWVCSNCDHNIFFSAGKLLRLQVVEGNLEKRP